MVGLMIFIVSLAVLFFGGLFAFRIITTRLAYSWVREWDKEWDVRLPTRVRALEEIHYRSLKGSLNPDYRNFKTWFRQVYWNECVRHQPGIPFGLQLKRELQQRYFEAMDEQILRGMHNPQEIVGLFNEEGIEKDG